MGFFSDLKEDLSQVKMKVPMAEQEAENAAAEEPSEAECMPTEELVSDVKQAEAPKEVTADDTVQNVVYETAVIAAGMTVAGDIMSEGSVDIVGCVNGNVDIQGTLNIKGFITGNAKAPEICAEGARINGEVISDGTVRIGGSCVVIGNIYAANAVIAGAVKGDIDVRGKVVLEDSAIVKGNIKSKTVQINNGAIIEGVCSQCYADVSPTAFFDEYKPEIKIAGK